MNLSDTTEGPDGFALIENAVDGDELCVISRWYNTDPVSAQINAPRSVCFGVGTGHAIPDELASLVHIATSLAGRVFADLSAKVSAAWLDFNHVTVQRHFPGQSLPCSRDPVNSSGPVTAIFTFECDAVYQFRAPEEEALRKQTEDYQTYQVRAAEQSVMFLGPRDARYLYTHQVARQFAKPRVTITLRFVPVPITIPV